MTFAVSNDPSGTVVVSVDGQLIVGNRNELKKVVIDALEAGGANFAFDFSSTG